MISRTSANWPRGSDPWEGILGAITMYGFGCQHCDGTVRERRVDREALRHKGDFVILEDVPIGVCDKCGARYFDASILRRVAEIGRGMAPTQRTLQVPVDRYAPA
jgi:YgiT-type zinc finger domain-containing protein